MEIRAQYRHCKELDLLIVTALGCNRLAVNIDALAQFEMKPHLHHNLNSLSTSDLKTRDLQTIVRAVKHAAGSAELREANQI